MGRVSGRHGRGGGCTRRVVRRSKGCGQLIKIKRVFERGKTAKILMKNQDR
jgi:hypothetical protein